MLGNLPQLPDLIHGFEFRLDPSDRLPTIPLPEYYLLTTPPRLLPWILTPTRATHFRFLHLSLPRLPLVVHVRLIQLLRLRNLLMEIPLWGPPPLTALGLSDPRKALLILRLPLLEPSAAIRSRELGAALGFDELDVVSPNAVTLDELFLLLVPGHLLSFPLIQERFIPCKVKRSIPGLFDERSAIPERVPERVWDQTQERRVV